MSQELTVSRVRFEHRTDALGIGAARPRLSWTVETASPGWRQAAYELEAATPDGAPCGDTGRVESAESVLVEWPFAPLASRQRLALRVRVWGADGSASGWSAPAEVEAGLLSPADWTARFVTPGWDEDTSVAQPGPLLRREFDVAGPVKQARLYITSLGLYQAQINGAVVGDHEMAPGWTSFNHRLRYQTFDVTGMLAAGRNALGAALGDGWYRGRFSFGGGRRNIFGDRLALLAQLEIEYADGTTERVVTDDAWRAARGPIQRTDIYDGETCDARLAKLGWAQAGFDASGWAGVRPVERDLGQLFAPYGPPVRRTQVVTPVSIFKSPAGKTLIDFGQNLVGRLRFTVSGPAGTVITFRHAEVLENGELGIRPLRTAKATDEYILAGGGPETWEPLFTFHGFRYAEVEGWPGELKAEDISAVVLHSDMERTGWFECSDPLLNRLHENVVWGMRGNFLDIPTDCPQRDERLGWTGDIQVFSPAASFIYDTAGFLQSWLRDLAAEQAQLGVVPFVVPTVMPGVPGPAAAWGDAACVVPWVLYNRFGDRQILADQLDSMKMWVDLLERTAGPSRLWDKGFQFGDWLDPSAPPDNPAAAKCPSFIVATAYFARSAEITGQAAAVLGKEDVAKHYLDLATEVRTAFRNEYMTPNGRLLSDSSTAYSLALQFDLLETAEQRQHAGARLAELARDSGYTISTGFVGTPLICDALCSVGQERAAFRLLMEQGCPSWLYSVTMGATTIWERWDSMLPDGSINPGEMTSFNHYALGAVADWVHRTVAGLAPAAPGYRKLAIAPRPGGKLTHARARHVTPYGIAESGWQIADGKITVEAVIPPNTTATVTLPGRESEPIEAGSGSHRWEVAYADPAKAFPKRTLDSTMGDLIEDEAAWAVVIEVMQKFAPGFGSQRRGPGDFSHMTPRALSNFMPGGREMAAALEEAFNAMGR
jgi:alpha-L-rhamnosidase